MLGWKMRRRAGLPTMTDRMMEVLRALRDAKANDAPWQAFEGVHGRTFWSLIERDWIVRDEGSNGTHYRITGRGEKALSVYEKPTRRFDGICPTCNERPRGINKNGRLMPYCRECNRAANLKQYRLKGHQYRDDSLCSCCHERPRHVTRSGKVTAYCIDCRRAQRVEERARHKAKVRAKLEAGELVTCIRCKKAPRYMTAGSVYDYCHACYRDMQNDYLRRKAFERAMGRAA